MGRRVPEFHGDDSMREVIFQNYRIVYRIVASDVRILTVRHSAMDPRTLGTDIADEDL
jgi:plasmid stabilization system protein ParE